MKKAVLLWTGGKDSTLAYLAVRDRYSVVSLATFVPESARPFRAHPVECMQAQARALGIPHRQLKVSEPFVEGYEQAIDSLASEGVEVLVTGDMDRVDGHESWIVERAKGRVEVDRPLWKADRGGVLQSLLEQEMTVVCTLALRSAFDEPFAGRLFDEALISELMMRHGNDGFDACGENGEYHTCVLDAPGFSAPLKLVNQSVRLEDDFQRLAFDGVELATP